MVRYGLEALSRGAIEAVLCDKSYKAINIIKQNVEKTKTSDRTTLIHNTYEKSIEEIKLKEIKFDIVFLDPPYECNLAEDASNKIIEYELLKEGGIIIIETDNKEKVIDNINNDLLCVYDERRYGRVHLIFLKLGRNG